MTAGILFVLLCLLQAAVAEPPQVILAVLVDDLGWADVGFHSQSSEIITPNINQLVKDGVELERHYVHRMCTPSRSSFLSGRLPVHVQLTLNNPEQPNSGIPRNMTVVAAKMREAGYQTYAVGKWDAGMATPTHTPEGRGFDGSLIYYEHKVDYWTQIGMQSSCMQYAPLVDLWDSGAPARGLNGTAYVDFMFRDRVLQIIEQHDASQPLFIYYTPHAAHCPLQVPKDWLARFNFSDDETLCSAQTPYIFPGSTAADYRCRSQYEAMVALMDTYIGNITDALKACGLWNGTLMVFSADNGGPLDLIESGSNNAPLRGGKYSDFEGGIRAASFVSGGYLPQSVRGTQQQGIVHVADWYATFAALAGVDPEDKVAAAAGLPPVDGVNVWPLISGANATSPRYEIPVSATTLIQGKYKLIYGPMDVAGWSGATYPNASSHLSPPTYSINCPTGCLYDVEADPTEHRDIASEHPDIVKAMYARLSVLEESFYTNNDTGVDKCPADVTMPCGCWAAMNVWGGYFGPYQY